MAEPVVRVDDVSKRFRIYHQRNLTLKETVLQRRRGMYEEFWALRDVSFEVMPGSTLGVIGENGSGKSTLLKCMAGILHPDRGSISTSGRLAGLLELGAGFHPEYSGRENIYLNGALLGLPRRYIQSVYDQIVEFSELERFIDNPVKTYSSGMYARLGFSIAVHLDPDVLIVDEILAVGDEAFQRRCFARINSLKAQGKTLVFVSHAMDNIRELCTECVWIEGGVLRMKGATVDVVPQYLAHVAKAEADRMRAETASVRLKVPSGRDGVGVTSVKFVGPRGPAHHFQTDDPFEIRVQYHAPWRLKNARFTVGLVREDGLLVFSTSTDHALPRGAALPATGVVSLSLPGLPLLDGAYRASVTIVDAETLEPFTILENAFPFRVHTPDGGGRGVARFAHTWSLPGQSVSKPV